ncbi:YgcG family protein, partial [Pseudomonas aeruginosa]|nr:YgcG family protein [Pseudomonas aeruginosa]
MSAITRYLAMLRLFGMLLCAAAIPSVATATEPVTRPVAAYQIDAEAQDSNPVRPHADPPPASGYPT